jgi:hypothetical protein
VNAQRLARLQAITNDVVVDVGKGCVLVLTAAEYARGVECGKRLRRREQKASRHEQSPANVNKSRQEPTQSNKT